MFTPPSLGEHKVRPYGKNIHLISNFYNLELFSWSIVSPVLEISFSLP
jgi:hypothetical protein